MRASQHIPVLLVIFYFASLARPEELPNECERGVKRHHPSQANVYQVFTRRNLLKQWIDYECEKFMIFDPRECACVGRHQEQLRKPSAKRKWTPQDGQREDEKDGQREEVELARHENVEQVNDLLDAPDANGHQPSDPNDNNRQEITEIKQQERIEQQNDAFKDDGSEAGCHLHQPAPDSPSRFERWTDGHWVTEDCNFPFYTGLVWNQKDCRCEWGPNRTAPVPVHQNVVPAACLMMFHLTFDDGQIKDIGRGVWIKLHNKEDASAVADSTAIGGYSGAFRGASLSIPFFKSNIIGPIFHIGFMYKLCPGNPDTDIILVHNDCKESYVGPSLVVSYQAWKQQIIIAMRTEESDVPVQEYCTVNNVSPQKAWMKVDLRYQDNYLEVATNDEVCVSSEKFYGPLATNNCPLTLLSDSFCGNLDEVIITRGCTEAHAIS